MNKVIFIGNFLSKQRGTIGPVERVMQRLENELDISKASVYDNKFVKFIDMLFKSTFFRYNTIHIDTYSSSALYFACLCAFVGKLRQKKVILNLHGGGLYNLYTANVKKKKLINKLFSFASVIVTPSLYLKTMFGREGFTVEYLPNTIDMEKFPYSPERVSNHKLLWVRAFNATYQPWLAVKTLYELRKKHPDATLTMIGPDKGLLNKTIMLISELGLTKHVTIAGKVPNNQLAAYYHTHQVFLNTTNTESFGVAVMEAASCGLPIVSTAVGELPYLWQNNENTMLINTFDEKEFASAVYNLFEDTSLYEKIKINARTKAESFSWDVVSKQWKELLN